eukprot:370431_1
MNDTKIPDINWLIIAVFKKREFNDAFTFIARVLFSLYAIIALSRGISIKDRDDERTQMKLNIFKKFWPQTFARYTDLVILCKAIYDVYFEPQTIPRLYSRIVQYLSHSHMCRAFDASEANFHKTALKYSIMYLHQKQANQLSELSKYCDQWLASNDMLGTLEQFRFDVLAYLRTYYRYSYDSTHMSSLVEDEYSLNKAFKYKFKLLNYFLQNQHLFRKWKWIISIPHSYGSHNGSFDLIEDILRQLTRNRRVNLWKRDGRFLKKVAKLCHAYHKSVACKNNQIKLVQSCHFLSSYYFWHRHNTEISMRYIRKAIAILRSYEDISQWPMCYMDILVEATKIESARNNYDGCIEFVSLKLEYLIACEEGVVTQAIQETTEELLQLKQAKIEMRRHPQNFVKLRDTYRPCCQSMPPKNDAIEAQYNEYVRQMQRYINDKKWFTVMNNVIKLKQCNYIRCNRKDLKQLKACERCKSVFYCCRRHQKMDWNTEHRIYCTYSAERMYYGFSCGTEYSDSQKLMYIQSLYNTTSIGS